MTMRCAAGSSSPLTTEPIMKRLFSIAQAASGQYGIPRFSVMSRRFVNFDQAQPYSFYQFQSPVRKSTGGERPLLVSHIGVLWIVYLPNAAGPTDADKVSPILNNVYDLLSYALRTTGFDSLGNAVFEGQLAGMPQTLGGLVTQCYEDGDGLTDEGLLSTPSLVVVPIKLLIGNLNR